MSAVVSWTFTCSGTTQSLAAWGIDAATLDFRSRADDVLSLHLGGTSATDEPVFAYGATGTLTRIVTDGGTVTPTIWFTGTCTTLHRSSNAQAEGQQYQFSGPWWRLARQPFMVNWKCWRAGLIQNTPMPDLLLNVDLLGAPVGTRAQIGAVIDWAVACGIAVQNPGTLDYPSLIICIDEARDLFCADVIERQLRWAPDAVTWFDYSTTPPTFRCLRRDALAPVTLALFDLTNHESIEITRRDDLTITEAYLVYKRIDNIDDTPTLKQFLDIYPGGSTGTSARPLVASVDLPGYSSSTAQFTVTSASLPATSGTESARIAWWKLKEPLFKSAYLKSDTLHIDSAVLTAEDGTVITSSLSTYPYELLDGQIPNGMYFGGAAAEVIEATVKATATYELYLDTAQNQLSEQRRKEISCRVKLTNVPTGDYRVLQSSSTGEDMPSGLAAALYTGLGTAQYEGSVSFVSSEVAGLVRVGNTLNLSGGRTEWASMAATVQSVREDIVQGRTTVQFGPTPRFSLSDFLDLLRATRSRRVWTNPDLRNTGQPGARDSVTLGKTLPRENTTAGMGAYAVHTTAGEVDESGNRVQIQAHAGDSKLKMSRIGSAGADVSGKGKIVLDLADTVKADETEKEVKIREKGSGLVMCSDDFTAGGFAFDEWVNTRTYAAGECVSWSTFGPTMGMYQATLDGRTGATPPWEGVGWKKFPNGSGPWIG